MRPLRLAALGVAVVLGAAALPGCRHVQTKDALTPHGISISWIDDWALYHALDGEVHCGTNAARSIPSVKWWETGR